MAFKQEGITAIYGIVRVTFFYSFCILAFEGHGGNFV